MAITVFVDLSLRWSPPTTPGPIVRCATCGHPQTRPFLLGIYHKEECLGGIPICVVCERKYRIKLSFTQDMEPTILEKRRDQGEPGSLNVSESQNETRK